jgi:hypothetical protein
VISIANIVVTSFYDESFIREKMMCKQHQPELRKADGEERREVQAERKGSAMTSWTRTGIP